MIEDGKDAGWLHLPPEALIPWASLHNIRLHNVKVEVDQAHPERGAGVFAQTPISCAEDHHTVLMTVPRDLILSRELVDQHAKVDKDLGAILDCLGDFGKTPRILILTYLLTQSYLLHPDLPRHFTHHPLTTYLRLLPLPPLPTTWPAATHALLRGTTLLPALRAKILSLHREYTSLTTHCAAALPWTTDDLFSDAADAVSFPDWVAVDAMYRSRALDFPGIGPCMAPAIDMANHAAGDATRAIYEVDGAGDAVLMLRAGQAVGEGEEVTITYGDDKGACEMVFSYGFLDHGREGAGELFLDLGLEGRDDPLARAKRVVAGVPPGVKIVDGGEDGVRWVGDWVWFLIVNEEDGLEFKIQRTVDGGEELRASWKQREITGAGELRRHLEQDELWDVWRLRAESVLQARVEEQLRELYGCEDEVNAMEFGEGTDIPTHIRNMALRLRELEGNLLEKAYAHFVDEKEKLAASEVVTRYLTAMNADQGNEASPTDAEAKGSEEEDDFS